MALWGLGGRTRSLTSQSVLLIGGRLAGFAFAFAIPIVLARMLDQAAFGTYKQFFLVAGLLVTVLPLGLDASLFYLIPQDPARAGNYFAQAFGALFAIGSLAAGALWIGREGIAALLNSPELVALMPLLAAYVLLELNGQLIEKVVVIEGQARLAALVLAVSDGLKAAALILPAVLTRDLFWIAIGAAAFALLRCASVAAWALWQYRRRVDPAARVVRFKEQWQHAVPFGVATGLHGALFRYHALFIASAFTPAQFAVYAVGSQQIPPVQIFFRSLFEVTLVRMTEYFGQGRRDAMRDLWQKLIAKQAIVIIPLIVALGALAEPFVVGLFTAKFIDAVPIFRISLALIALTMLNDHAVLRAVGSTRFIFLTSVAALGATVVLVPVLTHWLGLSGAVLGLVLALAFMKALGLAKLARLLDMRLRDVLPWGRLARYALASAVAAVLITPVQALFAAPLLRFFACGALFWLLYFVVGWIGGMFTPEDRDEVAGAWRATRVRLGWMTR